MNVAAGQGRGRRARSVAGEGPAEIQGERPPLPAGHPFLAFGRCRGFEAGAGTVSVRAVASVDGRQVDDGRQVGTIGFIEVIGDVPDGGVPDPRDPLRGAALADVLTAALAWLSRQTVGVVRCPVQLSTWFGHRAVVNGFVDEGGPKPFFLEPRNGRWLPDTLAAAGFAPRMRAVSRLVPNARAIVATEAMLRRAWAAGYRDRPLESLVPEPELALLHRLSSAIFAGAWGFSPMSLEEFAHLYGPLLPAVDPDLVRIVEDPSGEPVGFVFALPDLLGPPAGQPSARFVLKTIGVLPAARRAFPGLGSALVARVHDLAEERGYASGIHAQMAVGSYAERASARWGEVIRGYATFERAP